MVLKYFNKIIEGIKTVYRNLNEEDEMLSSSIEYYPPENKLEELTNPEDAILMI